MTPSQIILNDKYSQADGSKKVLMGVNQIMKDGNGVLLQKNNSVLFLVRLGKGDVELHLYTIDAPQALAKAIDYFIKRIKASDMKKVYFPKLKGGDKIIDMVRMYGIDVNKSDAPQYAYMAKV